MEDECRDCEGTGELEKPGDCQACSGTGRKYLDMDSFFAWQAEI